MELPRETARQLADIIHRLCGLVLGQDKGYLIRHRLEPLVRREGFAGFEQFLDHLRRRGGDRMHAAIIEAITTKETSFFRDPAFFRAMQRVVLPGCVAGLPRRPQPNHRIRLWSAACATGQEPYSLAMLIRDLVTANPSAGLHERDFAILASDISADALEVAKAGRYTRREVDRGLSRESLSRHFHPAGRDWEVLEPLRRMVQFRRFDLLHSPMPNDAFDVILCRNVLIYFDPLSRRRVCQRFFRQLQHGGWLILGAAESLFGVDDRFETVRIGRAQLYRKPKAHS